MREKGRRLCHMSGVVCVFCAMSYAKAKIERMYDLLLLKR